MRAGCAALLGATRVPLQRVRNRLKIWQMIFAECKRARVASSRKTPCLKGRGSHPRGVLYEHQKKRLAVGGFCKQLARFARKQEE